MAARDQGQPRPLEAFGPANPDPLNNQVFQLYDLATDWIDPVQRPRGEEPAEGQGDAGEVPRRGEEAPGPAARRVGGGAHRGAASRTSRPGAPSSPTRSRWSGCRRAIRRCCSTPPHRHRRHRGSAGAAPRHDRDLGRALRRLRLLPAQGASRSGWEPGRPRAPEVGRRRGARPGRHTVEFDFKYDGIGAGTLRSNNFMAARPGTGTLKVDGKVVATKRMPKTLPMILQWDESVRHRFRHAHRRERRRLSAAVHLHRKAQQAHAQVDRPQLAGRHPEVEAATQAPLLTDRRCTADRRQRSRPMLWAGGGFLPAGAGLACATTAASAALAQATAAALAYGALVGAGCARTAAASSRSRPSTPAASSTRATRTRRRCCSTPPRRRGTAAWSRLLRVARRRLRRIDVHAGLRPGQ